MEGRIQRRTHFEVTVLFERSRLSPELIAKAYDLLVQSESRFRGSVSDDQKQLASKHREEVYS